MTGNPSLLLSFAQSARFPPAPFPRKDAILISTYLRALCLLAYRVAGGSGGASMRRALVRPPSCPGAGGLFALGASQPEAASDPRDPGGPGPAPPLPRRPHSFFSNFCLSMLPRLSFLLTKWLLTRTVLSLVRWRGGHMKLMTTEQGFSTGDHSFLVDPAGKGRCC